MTRERALGLAQRAIYDGRLDRLREESNIADAIMAAVAAEREECAKIAESLSAISSCVCPHNAAANQIRERGRCR